MLRGHPQYHYQIKNIKRAILIHASITYSCKNWCIINSIQLNVITCDSPPLPSLTLTVNAHFHYNLAGALNNTLLSRLTKITEPPVILYDRLSPSTSLPDNAITVY